MTVESLINRLTQYASWLYYRQWERWELVAVMIAAAVLVLLLGVHRKTRTNIRHLHERSPIIGIRLAEHGRH